MGRWHDEAILEEHGFICIEFNYLFSRLDLVILSNGIRLKMNHVALCYFGACATSFGYGTRDGWQTLIAYNHKLDLLYDNS